LGKLAFGLDSLVDVPRAGVGNGLGEPAAADFVPDLELVKVLTGCERGFLAVERHE
jgi:hypothetical protein